MGLFTFLEQGDSVLRFAALLWFVTELLHGNPQSQPFTGLNGQSYLIESGQPFYMRFDSSESRVETDAADFSEVTENIRQYHFRLWLG